MPLLTRTASLPCIVAASTMLFALPAFAATVEMRSTGTATSSCQAALPAYEGLVRKRPLSVQNEGSATAFLTCSMPAGDWATRATLYVNSIDGQPHIVTCTGVVGYLTGDPVYVTKTVLATADGEQVTVGILPADVGRTDDLGSTYVSFSCAMPAGTGINDTSVSWIQQVGA